MFVTVIFTCYYTFLRNTSQHLGQAHITSELGGPWIEVLA
jgi:hypothetical protein